jgi:hypothetical protein
LGAGCRKLEFQHPARDSAAVETSAVESATVVSAAVITTADPTMCHGTAVITVPMPVAIAGMIAVAVPRMPIKAMAIIAVVPRARANEDAVHEPVRPVIPIRSAGVRIVAIISIRTNRRRPHTRDYWSNANAHRNLSVSASCGGKNQNCQKCHVF